MTSRRNFVKTLSAAGSLAFLHPAELFSTHQTGTGYWGIHPFIENNPDAVFIMRTSVGSIGDEAARLKAGQDFSRNLFVERSSQDQGFPISHNVILKPNLTCRYSDDSRYTVEGTMGIQTDSFFVEGMVNRMKEVGVTADRIYIRETNCPQDFDDGGYFDMAQRTGIHLKDMSLPVGEIPEEDLHWVDLPDGKFFKRIPYLWPTNTPNSLLINIAKFKTHAMGVTLCAKNIQGLNALPYVRHCTEYQSDMMVDPNHVQPGTKEAILANYERRKSSVPRWDRPGVNGGLWQETWATRCLDNNSVTKAALHIVEGIYGRDGHFINGPNNGLAKDYLTNIILFGKNPFHVDIIGHWLAGHEPGNFGLFHMAWERGLLKIMNPMEMPLFEWFADGSASQSVLTSFDRTPLKTMYLTRDYDGQTEDRWHLVNESFDYSGFSIVPGEIVFLSLKQNYPNPASSFTTIEYQLHDSGPARFEILDSSMRLIEVLNDRDHLPGVHFMTVNASRYPPGLYYYRLLYGGMSEARSMLVVH